MRSSRPGAPDAPDGADADPDAVTPGSGAKEAPDDGDAEADGVADGPDGDGNDWEFVGAAAGERDPESPSAVANSVTAVPITGITIPITHQAHRGWCPACACCPNCAAWPGCPGCPG
ncbi:hypothetical protein [Streptomyces sp. NPDC048603]|uniref:hypothetical protein n=1 Tax=Streptomyces sp. NPDC048603 TaxID=3365577 RepID=UPI003724081D